MISVRVGEAHMTPASRDHLQTLLTRDSGTKGTAASILNREGQRMVDIGQRIADEEIRDRPADRRTAESLAHGRPYRQCFGYRTARQNGYRLEIVFYNSHPAAAMVERGTRPHVIEARNATRLAFAYAGPGLGGGVGRAGTFAVTAAEAPFAFPALVNHPGAAPRRIMERTMMAWKQATPLRRR